MTLGYIVKGLGPVFIAWLYYYSNQYSWSNDFKLYYFQNELNIIYLSYIIIRINGNYSSPLDHHETNTTKEYPIFKCLFTDEICKISLDAILE